MRHRDTPVLLTSLLTSLQRAITSGVFDGQHEADARQFVGFHLGCTHGAILTAHSTRRTDVTTLITLDSTDAQRGYRAGRRWFFEEASEQERHFTDEGMLTWFKGTAQESWQYDLEDVWQYTLATLFGELSGLLFPLTQQECTQWEEDDRRVQAEIARLHAQYRQRETDPFPACPASQDA